MGLVTGAVLADLGHEVMCLDVDPAKVAALTAGQVPIYEPGLQELIARNCAQQRLAFTTSCAQAMPPAEVIFICVDTPTGPRGSADLSRVEAAARGIAQHLRDGQVVANKSTVPVGTGAFVRQVLERNCRPGVRFEVLSNPEFLREGSAVGDALRPDRIIIGCHNRAAAEKLVGLYRPLGRPILVTDVSSAELIKYACNAFLAVKISFINCIADLCERVGADISQVTAGMGSDPRIGAEFLKPGLGWGGSCFPKDTEALASIASALDLDFHLLKSAIAVNRERVPRLVARIEQALGELSGRTIAVLGLAFKPNTDDIREAKAIALIRSLLAKGARVRAYDPVAMGNARRVLPDVVYCSDAYEAAMDAQALVIATEWEEFKALDLPRLRKLLKRPLLFDGRNLYAPQRMAELGFDYISIGRRSEARALAGGGQLAAAAASDDANAYPRQL